MNVNEVQIPRNVIEAIAHHGLGPEHVEYAGGGKINLLYEKIRIYKSDVQKGMLAVEMVGAGGKVLAVVYVEDGVSDNRQVILHGMQGKFGLELQK